MHRLICTIGFTGKSAEEFFALLRDAGVECVVDVRQHRVGQLSGYAKHPDLEFFLKKIAKISYAHEPLLAPTVDVRKKYQESKDWDAYERGYLLLLKERRVPWALETSSWGAKIALLCSESEPEKCHRRLAAELLAGNWRAAGDDVEIRHLVAKRRKKERGSFVNSN
jgi:uncharacterized protein (DUF488 family)